MLEIILTCEAGQYFETFMSFFFLINFLDSIIMLLTVQYPSGEYELTTKVK